MIGEDMGSRTSCMAEDAIHCPSNGKHDPWELLWCACVVDWSAVFVIGGAEMSFDECVACGDI